MPKKTERKYITVQIDPDKLEEVRRIATRTNLFKVHKQTEFTEFGREKLAVVLKIEGETNFFWSGVALSEIL